MTRSVSEILKEVEAEFPNWVESQASTIAEWSLEDLREWVAGDDSKKLSLARYQADLGHFELKKFVIDNLGNRPSAEQVALATRLVIPRMPYAIGLQHLNTNSAVAMEEFVQSFMQVATIGWRDWTELLGRLGLREIMKYDIVRGDIRGGALAQGQTSHSYTYAILDVIKDWLDAKNTSTATKWRTDLFEEYAGGYGGWSDLVANWREPDPLKFHDIFHDAADYHVEQSRDMQTVGHDNDPGHENTHFEVEEDKYWLYPVLLFTFMRLREWEGLRNPGNLDHDLFKKGLFRKLPVVPAWPEDSLLDKVDNKFRSMFPQTPSLGDLPKLRAQQS